MNVHTIKWNSAQYGTEYNNMTDCSWLGLEGGDESGRAETLRETLNDTGPSARTRWWVSAVLQNDTGFLMHIFEAEVWWWEDWPNHFQHLLQGLLFWVTVCVLAETVKYKETVCSVYHLDVPWHYCKNGKTLAAPCRILHIVRMIEPYEPFKKEVLVWFPLLWQCDEANASITFFFLQCRLWFFNASHVEFLNMSG